MVQYTFSLPRSVEMLVADEVEETAPMNVAQSHEFKQTNFWLRQSPEFQLKCNGHFLNTRNNFTTP